MNFHVRYPAYLSCQTKHFFRTNPITTRQPDFTPPLPLFVICWFLIPAFQPVFAQESTAQSYFLIEFTDKPRDRSYQISSPRTILSKRTVQRRKKFRIPVDSLDLPISSEYQEAIRPFVSEILYALRWHNALVIVANDNGTSPIKQLSFVKNLTRIGAYRPSRPLRLNRTNRKRVESDKIARLDAHHGYAAEQIQSLNGHLLHRKGFKGKTKIIAVLDGGFQNINHVVFFDSLRQNEQILQTMDIVQGDSMVNQATGHGTQVLSVLAADIPGVMVGSAPDSEYLLYRTENVRTEARIEQFHWMYAVEHADSLGADVISSSLGYEVEAKDSTAVWVQELMIRTSWVGFHKGLLFVASAGNNGYDDSPSITVPAVAKNVLAVGSIDERGIGSDFSARGPSPGGVTKPDVVARGEPVVVASLYEMRVNATNGTSFSTPLVAGMVACLWEAFPNATNYQIKKAILDSSNRRGKPDHKLGFGEPDFWLAYELLKQRSRKKHP